MVKKKLTFGSILTLAILGVVFLLWLVLPNGTPEDILSFMFAERIGLVPYAGIILLLIVILLSLLSLKGSPWKQIHKVFIQRK